MKICNKCNIEKSVDEFFLKKSRGKVNWQGYCKECTYKQKKAWRESKKDGLTYVYYLPEEHYVGITNHVDSRMREHKKIRITDNYEIIAKFERRVDAHWFETMLHQRGYNGFY